MVMAGVANDPRAPKEGEPIVREYFKRKALAELGFTSNIGDLPAWKAEAFYAITAKINEHQDKKLKSRRKK